MSVPQPPLQRPAGRALLAGLVAGVMIGLVADNLLQPAMLQTAVAQIPDSGLQRNEMIARLDRIDHSLAAVLDLLRQGTIKVEVVESARKPAEPAAGSRTVVPPGRRPVERTDRPAAR